MIQLLEALEEAGRRNAAMVEAINWVVSPGRWIQREENIWEWRESPRGDFLKVLCQVVTEPDQLRGDRHGL
ncbi:hypothetical protein [Pantoea sp. App145]|uniref:hypothetical protein n=1 Tax=Pantoea sp. App145 TaxID=3071567 RepID=UPI003A7FF9E3